MISHSLTLYLLTLPCRSSSDRLSTTKAFLEKQKIFLSQNNSFFLTWEKTSNVSPPSPQQTNKSSITKKTIITAQKSSIFLAAKESDHSKATEKAQNDIFGIWDATIPTNSPSKFTSLSLDIETEGKNEHKNKPEDDEFTQNEESSYSTKQDENSLSSSNDNDAYDYSFQYVSEQHEPQNMNGSHRSSNSRKEKSNVTILHKEISDQNNFTTIIPSTISQPTIILYNVTNSYIPSESPTNYLKPLLPPSSSIPPIKKPTKQEKIKQKNLKLKLGIDERVESDLHSNTTDKRNGSNEAPTNNEQQVITTIIQTETIISQNNNKQQVIKTTTQSNTKVSSQLSSTEVQNSLQHQQPQQQQQNVFDDSSHITFKHGEKVGDNNVFIEDHISIEHQQPSKSNDQISIEYQQPPESKKEISMKHINDNLISSKAVKGSFSQDIALGIQIKSKDNLKTKTSKKGKSGSQHLSKKLSTKKTNGKGGSKKESNNYHRKESKKYSSKKLNSSIKGYGIGKSSKSYQIINEFYSILELNDTNNDALKVKEANMTSMKEKRQSI